MALDPKQRNRLIRFLEIAGQSAAEGEALAALRQAWKLVQSQNLALHEALAQAGKEMLDVQRLAGLEMAAFQRGRAQGQQEGAALQATAARAEYDKGFAEGKRQGALAQASQMQAAKDAQGGQTAGPSSTGPYGPRYGHSHVGGIGANQQGPTQNAYSSAPLGSIHGAPARRWQDAARELVALEVDSPGTLNDKSAQFVRDILARGWPALTPKQAEWLESLCDRFEIDGW